MARREGSALVWQKTDERLKEAVREAFEIAPLPNPPLEILIVMMATSFLYTQVMGL